MDLPPPRFEVAAWETQAAARLAELLEHKTLEDLLGGLTYTVRKLREIQTGQDVRGRKEDIASALLILHGRDLFADKEIRLAAARKCAVECPGAWHPGKEAALEFVDKCGFPRELAGILTPQRLADYELLEGRVNLPPLLDFQQELYFEILRRLQSEQSRAIATLPTGAGKTRVAVDVLKDYRKTSNAKAVIWLAHTEELCEQAFQCFKEVWEASTDTVPLTSIRYWGNYSKSVDIHSHALRSLVSGRVLAVSTPLRLLNAIDRDGTHQNEFVAALIEAASVAVVDEAHRAGAPSYQELVGRIRKATPPLPSSALRRHPTGWKMRMWRSPH